MKRFDFLTNQFERHFLKIKRGLIFLYCYLKISQYLEARSLFIDEANLARNIAEKGFLDLFSNLDYEQYAPPIFLFLSKLSCEIVGYNEYGLRLVPLLVSLISLFLVLKVIDKVRLPKITLVFTLVFLTLAWNPMVYATQFKQYGFDLLVTLSLFLYVLNTPLKKVSWREVLMLSFIGSVAVYASMSSVFVLFSIGAYYLYEAIRGDDYKLFLKTLPSYLIWISTFLVYYFTVLNNDIGNEHLNKFHSDYFLSLPISFEKLEQNYNILLNYISSYTYIGIALPIFAISLLGVIMLCKKNNAFIVLYLPVLLCVVVSMSQQYSLIPRLLLFTCVGFYFALMEGLIFLSKKTKIGYFTSFVFGLVLLFNPKLYLNLVPNTFRFEETKEAMEYISLNNPQEIICTWQAMPAYQFYTNNYSAKKKFKSLEKASYHVFWEESINDVIKRELDNKKQVWILFGHDSNAEIQVYSSEIETQYAILDFKEFKNAAAVLVSLPTLN